jgi:hypothetical protein
MAMLRGPGPARAARHPAAHVVHLGPAQVHAVGGGQRCSRTSASWYIASVRARQPALDPQVLQEALQRWRPAASCRQRRGPPRRLGHAAQPWGSRRDSAALATSPMRIRNSVPMSAL